jgi:tetratricopeptide (TPR) repeat protein
MPKLSPLHWVILVVFLAFYGFAVFAFTRDYYVRNPPRAAVGAAPAQAPHDMPQTPTWIQRQMQDGADTAPIVPTGDNTAQLHQQGDQLFAQKRYADAIPFYERVLELDPGDLDAHNDLGLALHYTGQSPRALEILKAGTEKGPEFQRIWLTLGYVYANSGDAAGARPALEKARSLGPDNGVGQEAIRLLGLLEGE